MPRLKDLTGSGFSALAATSIQGAVDPAVTATGSTGPTAYPINLPSTKVTVTAASTGVILPALNTAIGDVFDVSNDGANALTIYPPAGGTIDGSASKSLAAGGWLILQLWSGDGLTWKSK